MNILSAYSAYARPASIYSGQSHAPRPAAERPQAIAEDTDALIEFIPARASEDSMAEAAASGSELLDLPKSVQTFVATEQQDGGIRVGRFLDIHA